MATIVLFLADKKVGEYEMKTSPFVVGRDPTCGLHIDNAGVSRRHCQFLYTDSEYYIEDAGSSNGTFVGGTKVDRRLRIKDGDKFNIGKYVLLFQDNGFSFLPTQAAEGAEGGGGGAVAKTFQMDAGTLRKQMEKAALASAQGVAKAQRASDVAKDFDPDAPLVIRGKEDSKSILGTIIKVLGIAILVAGILVGVLFAIGSGGGS